MKQYRVQWKYKSSLGGPWRAGETVALDDDRAADIGRDSPGVLALLQAEPKLAPEEISQGDTEARAVDEPLVEPEEAAAADADIETRLLEAPAFDRMAKAGKKRGR
jgi:hypothetical protein